MTTTAAAVESVRTPRPVRSGAVRRLVTTPLGLVTVIADLFLLALVIFGPILWGASSEVFDTDNMNSGPSAAHIFGTDNLGRDILRRMLVATRLSMGLAVGATLIGVVIGVILGTIPSVVGPRIGRGIVTAVNIAVAFPGLLLALFFAAIFGASQLGAVVALGIAIAPGFARLIQTLAAGIADRDYVSAAKVLGVSRMSIIWRHVLPNVADTIIVNISLGAGGALLAFAGLSYLGLGVQQPAFDWGRMLNDGLNGIYINPMAALGPSLAIILAGLALNLTGEASAQLVGRRVPMLRERRLRPRLSIRPAVVGTETDDVLDVAGLTVQFPSSSRDVVTPVRGIDLRVGRGESVGIVGESGSGKSLTAMAVAALVQVPGKVDADGLLFDGVDLTTASASTKRHLLGTKLAMVFQDPMSSLNPVIKVGPQLAEVATEHQGLSKSKALSRAVQRLHAVKMPAADRRARQYPHEFSGGMRQRAMIAMGLMGTPSLLIADEPTTALDATVQQQVLQLIEQVRADNHTALLLISHDVAVIASMCDRVVVMYAGRVVEELAVDELLAAPQHPYTRVLLAAVPTMDTDRTRPLTTIPGRPPHPSAFPVGCAFASRCAFATQQCTTEDPALQATSADASHRVACWHPQTGQVEAVVLPADKGATSLDKGFVGLDKGIA